MATAKVNGVELYYEAHGSGEPVFLTHGSWSDATAWDAVVPALAKRFEVVTWDRRGHSRSTDGVGPGSSVDDASDLAGLIEHHGQVPAHVVGSSAGGTVVLNLLADRSDLVASAAVHEAAIEAMLNASQSDDLADRLAEEKRQLISVGEMIDAGDGRAAAEYFVDRVALGPGAWEQFPEDVKNRMVTNAATYAGELSEWFGLMVDVDSIAASGVPIMITVGTASPPLIAARTKELIRRLTSAQMRIMEGTGHVPYRTHPDLWLDTLLSYYEAVAGVKG